MGIMDLLKKSEKLVFWNRCRLHSGKADFRNMVLNGYHSPDFLELHHYGDAYQGRIVYNATETGNGIGFFAELGMTLIKLHYADDRGLVPYIHWGESYVYYEPEGIRGEKNAFLHYFKSASEVESIDCAAYVLDQESWHCSQVKALYGAVSYDVSQAYIDAMARMLRKYIRYNDETEKYLKDAYEKLLGDKKTIAVHYRGTDFNKGYNNHPVPVQVEQEVEPRPPVGEGGGEGALPEALQHRLAGQKTAPVPLRAGAHGHQLDKAQLPGFVSGQREEVAHLVVVEAADEDGVQL